MAVHSGFARIVSTRLGAIAVTLVGLLVVVAIIGPPVWGDTAQQLDPGHGRQGASAAHWLGTDDLGRDVLARTLAATRLSLVLACATAAIATVLGCLLGAVAAISGGRVRGALTNSVSWALAFPPLIVALFVTAVLGPGAVGAVLAVGLALVPSFARVAQTLAVEVAGSDYVAAARTVGIGRRRLIARYVLPNIAEPLAIQATVTVGVALVSLSALSFLGLGVQPPRYDWGQMLSEGLDKIFTTPVVALAPACAIAIGGIAFALLGEAIARAFQPPARATGRHRSYRDTRPTSVEPRAPEDATQQEAGALIAVRDLAVRFATSAGEASAVEGVSLDLKPGERVGIVGESGSGKTLTALAIARLLPSGARASASRLRFEGHDLLDERARELRRLLGTRLAVIFQDPASSLNPALRIGRQLGESVRAHRGMSARDASALAVRKLAEVHVPAPELRARQYPHELSGGMRQRAMIAMGLMGEPSLILADEPTTALDVTVQAQILDLMRDVNAEHGTAIVLISHDLGVVAELCSRVVVMYAGGIVEDGDVETLLHAPAHPYTRALVAAIPDFETPVDRPLATIPGRPPSLDDPPAGCPFAPRCPLAVDVCGERPPLRAVGSGHSVACWRAGETPATQDEPGTRSAA